MKILTVHPTTGKNAHLIPLFVLHKRYIEKIESIDNKFLTPQSYHSNLKSSGINVVNIDNSVNYKMLSDTLLGKTSDVDRKQKEISRHLKRNIVKAIETENPDIIIEDFEPFTVIPCKRYRIPRVSIHRTGFFRSIPLHLRNPKHIHSCEKSSSGKKLYDASSILGHKIHIKNILDPESALMLSEYSKAEAKIIPGIPSIEVLPNNIDDKESYFYSGPLTVEDNPSKVLVNELNHFFKKNSNKRKVFITTGTVDRSSLEEYVLLLVEKGYAVITTQNVEIKPLYIDAVFFNSFLPLNYICSKVDLFIHQCGSGIYHYPILNMTPFITIGTQCYDREDVAQRLQLLKAGKHVPHPKDDKNYLSIFEKHLIDFEKNTLTDFQQMLKLKEEIYETMLNFDIQEVIDYASLKQMQSL